MPKIIKEPIFDGLELEYEAQYKIYKKGQITMQAIDLNVNLLSFQNYDNIPTSLQDSIGNEYVHLSPMKNYNNWFYDHILIKCI